MYTLYNMDLTRTIVLDSNDNKVTKKSDETILMDARRLVVRSTAAYVCWKSRRKSYWSSSSSNF